MLTFKIFFGSSTLSYVTVTLNIGVLLHINLRFTNWSNLYGYHAILFKTLLCLILRYEGGFW